MYPCTPVLISEKGRTMIAIDYQSRLPLYEQIVRRFQTLILSGAMPPDTQMPSVRSLAVELSINPNTIQKAYSMLEQQGYIYPVKGRGNFVADTAVLVKEQKGSLFQELERLLSYGMKLGITKEEYLEAVERLCQKEEHHD
ncbi:GntR family transcriptional regulator [Ruminococcus turbiniformis]